MNGAPINGSDYVSAAMTNVAFRLTKAPAVLHEEANQFAGTRKCADFVHDVSELYEAHAERISGLAIELLVNLSR